MYPRTFSVTALTGALSFLFATPAHAQIAPGHAVVITESASPKSLLLEVDPVSGRFLPVGRFTFDTNAPLGVAFDPVDRDLVVAIKWQGGTRLLRLPMRGRVVLTPRVLADVPGEITDLEMGFGDSVFFTLGGANGGVFAIPRNGGPVRTVTPLARARGIFNFGHGNYSAFVLQAGAAGPPVVDPRIVVVDYGTGAIVNRQDLTGYRPLDVNDLVVVPNAVLNKLIANADGTIGEVVLNRVATVPLTPTLPAGGTRRIRRLGNGHTVYVLGGRADPRLKSFAGFDNGRSRGWTMITAALPGDPVDFDFALPAGAKTVVLGQPCRTNQLSLGAGSGGEPRVGNGAFALRLFRATASAPAALAVGLSDDRFGNRPLPQLLPGGCTLYTSVDAVLLTFANNLGIANQPLPIPNNPALSGMIVFAQWAQGSPTGLLTSAATALHIEP